MVYQIYGIFLTIKKTGDTHLGLRAPMSRHVFSEKKTTDHSKSVCYSNQRYLRSYSRKIQTLGKGNRCRCSSASPRSRMACTMVISRARYFSLSATPGSV